MFSFFKDKRLDKFKDTNLVKRKTSENIYKIINRHPNVYSLDYLYEFGGTMPHPWEINMFLEAFDPYHDKIMELLYV